MKFLVFCILLTVVRWNLSEIVCNESYVAKEEAEEHDISSRVLSRRKRYLIFPDGSSLQLVFCCQTAALIPIGDIFLFGNTAALAWNLPTDPELLLKFKKHDKLATRRGDTHIYYVDEDGEFLAKVPYKRPSIVNPVFAKRSVDLPLTNKEKLNMKIDRKKMHTKQIENHFLKNRLDEKSVEFHRSSRVGLFEKIEGLITALGGDGRQCVLRKLCETRNIAREQGTFLQEILRVVFTLPKGMQFELDDHKEYDQASSRSTDCAALYPCNDLSVPVQL